LENWINIKPRGPHRQRLFSDLLFTPRARRLDSSHHHFVVTPGSHRRFAVARFTPPIKAACGRAENPFHTSPLPRSAPLPAPCHCHPPSLSANECHHHPPTAPFEPAGRTAVSSSCGTRLQPESPVVLRRHLPPHELTVDSHSPSSSGLTQSTTCSPFVLCCSPTRSPTPATFC
jgi:hypothetical protein